MGNSKRRATVSRGPAPAQRTGWQAQFHAAILDYLVKHGTLVREGDDVGQRYSYSAWEEYGTWNDDKVDFGPHELFSHLAEDCAIDPDRSRYEDSVWYEFAGTFSDDQWPEDRGIDAIVTCRCGQVQDRRWRYTGGHAELLRGITGN